MAKNLFASAAKDYTSPAPKLRDPEDLSFAEVSTLLNRRAKAAKWYHRPATAGMIVSDGEGGKKFVRTPTYVKPKEAE